MAVDESDSESGENISDVTINNGTTSQKKKIYLTDLWSQLSPQILKNSRLPLQPLAKCSEEAPEAILCIYKDKYSADFDEIPRDFHLLHSTHFRCLFNTNNINSEVIDSFMLTKKIQGQWRDVDFYPSALTLYILGDSRNTPHDNTFRGFKINMEFKNIVFLPYCFNNHWCLLVLNIPRATIIHLDPFGNDNSRDCADIFLKYVENWKRLNPNNNSNLTRIKWRTAGATLSRPTQSDGYNCGNFVMYYMEALANNTLSAGSEFNPDIYRVNIAETLLKYSSDMSQVCLGCTRNNRSFTHRCAKCNRPAHRTCADNHFTNENNCISCSTVDVQPLPSSITGLANPPGSNNCWLNSSVQALNQLPIFASMRFWKLPCEDEFLILVAFQDIQRHLDQRTPQLDLS